MRADNHYLFAPFRLDPINQQLWRGTQAVIVRRKTFEVLCYLVEHRGELVTKTALFDAVWPHITVSDSIPAICVRELRKALGDEAPTRRFIDTVHGRGYRFIAEVTIASGSGAAINLPALVPNPAPIVVGREAQLAQLRGWFARVLEGQRQIVFVAGEPGIGKTTLTGTFLNSMGRETDARIGRGQCIEQYGAGEPYMPVLEALTRLGQEVGSERLLEVLHRFAPSWLAQMPALLSETEREKLARAAEPMTQQRMLREIAQALEALSADLPLVLFLEDLHWSDFSTLELISALARRGEPARLLVIGTYRLVETLTGDHPLRTVKGELELHRLCSELRLAPLAKEDVAEYLAIRFSDGADKRLLSDLALAIHNRSEGNPLFMTAMVDNLVEEGMLNASGKSIANEFVALLGAGKIQTPRGIVQMIERNLERLDSDDQAVLQAASVAGAEFSSMAVAVALGRTVSEIEACCARLSRDEQFVHAQGMSEWPDGSVAEKFRFAYALYSEVLYGRVPAGKRIELHRRIAELEEHAYGERAAEVAAELAHHFSRANDKDKAAKYFHPAGQQAMGRGAFADAIGSFQAGLDLLQTLPHGRERTQRELPLQIGLGPALAAVRGPASPEVELAYSRALALGRRVGDHQSASAALVGLHAVYQTRGQLRAAYQNALPMLRRAVRERDASLLLQAHAVLGVTTFHRGELLRARRHFEIAIPLYPVVVAKGGRPLALGADLAALCLAYAAFTWWLLGYPQRALASANQAVRSAQALSDPHSLAFAEFFFGTVLQFRREAEAAAGASDRVAALAQMHGFPFWLACASPLRAYAMAAQGRTEEAVAQIRDGLAARLAAGAGLSRPYYLTKLAEACAEDDRLDEGLAALNEALSVADQHQDLWFEAETLRLKGELLLRQDDSRVAEVRSCFQRAIEVARSQRAKSLELRAAMSLARLLATKRKGAEALDLVAQIYSRFSEGFDTADLKEAKALLDKSGKQPSSSFQPGKRLTAA